MRRTSLRARERVSTAKQNGDGGGGGGPRARYIPRRDGVRKVGRDDGGSTRWCWRVEMICSGGEDFWIGDGSAGDMGIDVEGREVWSFVNDGKGED